MKNFIHKVLQASLMTSALLFSAQAATSTPQNQVINGKHYFLKGENVEIATWKNGALGSYTAIHDDLCSNSSAGIWTYMQQIMEPRGLIGTLGVITSNCESLQYTTIEDMRRHGHEIMSHSHFHGGAQNGWDAVVEIDTSKAILERELPGLEVEFFIFPFDQFTDVAKDHLRASGYLGARSGDRQIITDAAFHAGVLPHYQNAYDFADPFELMFDAIPASFSGYKDYPQNGEPETYYLKAYVQDAVDFHGWAMHEMHGINDHHMSIDLAPYTNFMDYLEERVTKNEIWMDGPTKIIKYRFAREHCGTPSLNSQTNGYELSFSAPSNQAQCEKYQTAITTFVKTTGISQYLRATQAGKILPTKKIDANYFSVEIDPLLGPATLTEYAWAYIPHPVLDLFDLTPHATVANYNPKKTYFEGDKAYFEGTTKSGIFRARYWTLGQTPDISADWITEEEISNKFVVNTRAYINGSVSPQGKNIYNGGTDITVNITPNAGWMVNYILVDGVNVGEVTSKTFSNLSGHHTVDAFFKPIVGNTHIITATASNNGSISPAGTVSAVEGTSKAFTFTPDTDYAIEDVLVNGLSVGSAASHTIQNIQANTTISVSFVYQPPTKHTITITSGANGNISPSTVEVIKGQNQTFTFSANSGYEIDVVTVDGVAVAKANSYTFNNLQANANLAVTFKEQTTPSYIVTATADQNGTITPLSSTVLQGNNQVFTITPNSEFQIDKISVDGSIVTTANPFTLNNVQANTQVAVTFKATVTGGACTGISNWDANQSWTEYSIGDKRIDDEQIWTVTNVAYTIYQPSGSFGSYGWNQVGVCN